MNDTIASRVKAVAKDALEGQKALGTGDLNLFGSET